LGRYTTNLGTPGGSNWEVVVEQACFRREIKSGGLWPRGLPAPRACGLQPGSFYRGAGGTGQNLGARTSVGPPAFGGPRSKGHFPSSGCGGFSPIGRFWEYTVEGVADPFSSSILRKQVSFLVCPRGRCFRPRVTVSVSTRSCAGRGSRTCRCGFTPICSAADSRAHLIFFLRP